MKKLILVILCLMIFTACEEQPDQMYKYSFEVNQELIDSTKNKPEKPKEEKESEPQLVTEHGKLTEEVRDISLSSDVLEIGEKMFIAQINDIYYNIEDYEDKTIIVEGMFTFLKSSKGQDQKPAVYRLGPGCCGNDGWGGFLLDYEGDYPEPNDWIRVVGKLEVVQKDHFRDLYLKVDSLEVKAERGAERVQQ